MSIFDAIWTWGTIPAFFINLIVVMIYMKREILSNGDSMDGFYLFACVIIAGLFTIIWIWVYIAIIPAYLFQKLVKTIWKVVDKWT